MLGEEIRKIFVCAYEGNANGVIFDDFAYEKMAALNVLGAIMVFWIVGEITSRSVVTGE